MFICILVKLISKSTSNLVLFYFIIFFFLLLLFVMFKCILYIHLFLKEIFYHLIENRLEHDSSNIDIILIVKPNFQHTRTHMHIKENGKENFPKYASEISKFGT